MGLSMEFYAGDARKVGAAFSDPDGEDWGAGAAAYADFSLHLSPSDLDLFSEVASSHLEITPLRLWDCLGEEVGSIDGGETGAAHVVNPAWVALIARLSAGDSEFLATRWIERVAERLGESIQVTEAATAAVRSLIDVCQRARQDGLPVLFLWYL
jgi:hypothetical protein